MPLQSAEISNFKVLSGDRRYDLPEGLIGLHGGNGIGKSTLVNAIAWAFYGPDVLRTKKADVVTWGQKECKVSVNFELDGHQYTCVRWQNASGTTGNAQLWRDDADKPLADGLTPVTEEMGRLLGVDYVGFIISVFARQDELNGLASLQPTRRMQTVLRLLGIDNVTAAIKTVRERANQDRRHLETLRANLVDMAALEAALNDAYGDGAEADDTARAAQQVMNSLTNAIEETKAKRNALEPDRQQRAQYVNLVSNARQAVMFAESAVNMERTAIERPLPADPVKPDLLPVPEHLDDEALREQYESLNELRRDAEGIRGDIRRLREEIAGLANAECPTCHRPYDNADQIERTRAEKQEALDGALLVFKDMNDEGARLKAEYEEAYRINREALKIERANEQAMDRYRSDVRTHALIVAQREEAKGKLTAAEERLAAAKNDLAVLESKPVPDPEPRFRELLIEQESLQNQHSQASVEWSRAVAQRERASAEIARLTADKQRAEGRVAEVESLETSVVAYDTAAAELAKMKENLIARVIPQLTDTASALVAEMTTGKYTELDLTHDYEIRFRNEQGDWKDFENLSGGEQRVFALALRLAISELRSNRLGVLFLDEVFESLDTETGRVEAVWGAIENLMRRYHQAILVTHVESLKERAPTTIRVGS